MLFTQELFLHPSAESQQENEDNEGSEEKRGGDEDKTTLSVLYNCIGSVFQKVESQKKIKRGMLWRMRVRERERQIDREREVQHVSTFKCNLWCISSSAK